MPSAPRIIEDPVNVTVMRNEPNTLRCAFEGDNSMPFVAIVRNGALYAAAAAIYGAVVALVTAGAGNFIRRQFH